MNIKLAIAFLTIAIVGISDSSQAQITITSQEATVYQTTICQLLWNNENQILCNGLGISTGNSSINYHFAIYDYSQQELSPLAGVAFGVPQDNPSEVFGLFIYTNEGLTFSTPATGSCQRMSNEIICNAVTPEGEKFTGRAVQ